MEYLLPEEQINGLTLQHPSFLNVIPITAKPSPSEEHESIAAADRHWEQALALHQKEAHLKTYVFLKS